MERSTDDKEEQMDEGIGEDYVLAYWKFEENYAWAYYVGSKEG